MSDDSANDRDRRAAERAHDLVNDKGKRLIDAATRDAQEAIKTALLINSGAAVAILAFISSLASKPNVALADLKPITNCLYWFASGVVAAGVTSAFAYLSNGLYSAHFFDQTKTWTYPYVEPNETSKRKQWWAQFFNWAGVILTSASLILFVVGVVMAARAILNLVDK